MRRACARKFEAIGTWGRGIIYEIEESDLPGIGKRFSLSTTRGGTLTLILHHDGRRDVYYDAEGERGAAGGGDEGPFVFSLTDEEARKVGGILGGTYFRPTRIDQLKSEINRDIKAVRVPEGSPVVGKRMDELDMRKKMGVSIVSVVRGDDIIREVGADLVVRPGDILLVLGANKNVGKMAELIGDGKGGDGGGKED